MGRGRSGAASGRPYDSGFPARRAVPVFVEFGAAAIGARWLKTNIVRGQFSVRRQALIVERRSTSAVLVHRPHARQEQLAGQWFPPRDPGKATERKRWHHGLPAFLGNAHRQ
jgi:hypothetical protein